MFRTAFRRLRGGVRRTASAGAGAGGGAGPVSVQPITWARLAGLGLVSASLLASYQYLKRTRHERRLSETKTIGKPLIGGPFQLVDSAGALVRSLDLYGRYLILYFGFTRCPDLCPTEMTKITRAVHLIDGARSAADPEVVPVFITVDPHRDTPRILHEYKKEYHPRLIALTGSIGDITSVAKKYRVYFSAPEGQDDDYMVDHSLFAYLIGRDGTVVEIFGRDMTAEQIAAKVAAVMVQDRQDDGARQLQISAAAAAAVPVPAASEA